jgi:hypothetical protein
VPPTVDREKLAVLRALRRAFGDVQVLEVDEHQPATPAAAQGELFEEPAPA